MSVLDQNSPPTLIRQIFDRSNAFKSLTILVQGQFFFPIAAFWNSPKCNVIQQIKKCGLTKRKTNCKLNCIKVHVVIVANGPKNHTIEGFCFSVYNFEFKGSFWSSTVASLPGLSRSFLCLDEFPQFLLPVYVDHHLV